MNGLNQGSGKRRRWGIFEEDEPKEFEAGYYTTNGIASLFKLTRTRRPLFIIGHRVTPAKKAALFRSFRPHTHFTRLFLHSSEQYKTVIEQFKVPSAKVKLLPYQVDTEFWKHENATSDLEEKPAPYICTAGLEFRDYETLIEAVRDLPVLLKIGATSYWSKRKTNILSGDLPANVEVRSYNYTELRDLYASSRFVVVPLIDVDFQAGITVILEAMAMGKAIIVTRSQGQGDTVVDRRRTLRNEPTLPTVGNLSLFFGDNIAEVQDAQTGFYVQPGNPAELRRAIEYLLDNPKRSTALGQNGRKMVETLMRVEQFAERIKQIIEDRAFYNGNIFH
jgi:glycosyltransferase involved in cell wall biosynthesis